MVIVTGGAGFIGSCLINYLNNKGIEDIIVVDHMTESDKWKNLIGKKFVDYLDKDEFRNLVNDDSISYPVNKIYHMGACSATTEKDVNYLIDNNFAYSKELFAFALRNDAQFIYASSAATYGGGENGYSDKTLDKLRPLNAYGYSKYVFDNWLHGNGYLNHVLGLKFFNVFGPNEYHKGSMSSMVFKAWKQVKDTGTVKLFESNDPAYVDGGQMRDFIYIKDVCRAIDKLEENSVRGIYNLGTGKANTWNALAGAVFASMNLPVNIEYIKMPESIIRQYQNFTEADMSKFGESSESFEFMTLEDSVSDYINTYLQKDWKYL